VDDEQRRDALIAEMAAQVAELLAITLYERDFRQSEGQDVASLQDIIGQLAELADRTHDLEVLRAIRAVIQHHGPGPYPADELATLARQDPEAVRRVLANMVANGLAAPPAQPRDVDS
jgi:hypothetical protein